MKGLSPIVASVILIAITMAIAGVLSFWAGNFVQRNIQQTENTTEDLSCLNALFDTYSTCKYNSASKEISVVLENKRAKSLQLDSLYVFYPNDLVQFKIPETLPPNLFYFKSSKYGITINPGFDHFELRSACPGVFKSFNCTE